MFTDQHFFHDIDQIRPSILLSACLDGDNVRYDGKHKQVETIQRFILPHVNVIKTCPEVGAGLTVPRPPVQLVKSSYNATTHIIARGVDDPSLDVTKALIKFSKRTLKELPDVQACILKARSPSCGISTTPLHDNSGRQIGVTNGIFAAQMKSQSTSTLMVHEEQLTSEYHCKNFLFNCFCLHDIALSNSATGQQIENHYKKWLGLHLNHTEPSRAFSNYEHFKT